MPDLLLTLHHCYARPIIRFSLPTAFQYTAYQWQVRQYHGEQSDHRNGYHHLDIKGIEADQVNPGDGGEQDQRDQDHYFGQSEGRYSYVVTIKTLRMCTL